MIAYYTCFVIEDTQELSGGLHVCINRLVLRDTIGDIRNVQIFQSGKLREPLVRSTRR
jgi:hypothetical protein